MFHQLALLKLHQRPRDFRLLTVKLSLALLSLPAEVSRKSIAGLDDVLRSAADKRFEIIN